MKRSLCFLFSLVLVLGITAGCQKKSMTLEYVVPNGFSGIIELRAGLAEGVELKPTNGWISQAVAKQVGHPRLPHSPGAASSLRSVERPEPERALLHPLTPAPSG